MPFAFRMLEVFFSTSGGRCGRCCLFLGFFCVIRDFFCFHWFDIVFVKVFAVRLLVLLRVSPSYLLLKVSPTPLLCMAGVIERVTKGTKFSVGHWIFRDVFELWIFTEPSIRIGCSPADHT